ncbi:DUF3471 domain-containing protein [Nocardia pseudobrasiliensis]|uniref:Uncharacterized protein DUF3471 n=1 Tax=Nocardia pseudobrasiliensis TaxID=45979 RepID=A0A370IFL9_9NOCA|nr:DUF3471 domain-containing protein [Nocardia pseudobrasiliensis]RDI68254.1 uncharacterized protein DUF3471 [Nocardia pseudobrasiliensis]
MPPKDFPVCGPAGSIYSSVSDLARWVQANLNDGAKEATQRQRAASAATPHAHPEAAYLGEYHHPGYGTLRVTAGADGLTARLGVLDLGMRHRHFETWDLDLTAVETALTLTFTTDAEGEVSSLAVPFEPSVSPIVFRRLPQQGLSAPERLATFTGDYLMGQLRPRVRLDHNHLTLDVASGQAVVLEPTGERTFTVRRQPGVRIQFVVDDSRVTEMEIHPGGGVYVRQESDT